MKAKRAPVVELRASQWFADGAELEAMLEQFNPTGDVLELACRTGLWTQRLADHADRVTVVDGSQEMLDLCRARVGDSCVDYVEADLTRIVARNRTPSST